MGYLKDRAFGYLNSTNDGKFIRNIPGQVLSGYSVGIVCIENENYPMLPGNVVNAYSYSFPVRIKAVANLENTRLFSGDRSVVTDIIETARYMVEREGVRAICSACGFFGNYQKDVAAALDVPVAMSSLVQIPMIRGLLKPNQKIGIITANAGSFTAELLENCNVVDEGDLVVTDARYTANFAPAIVDNCGYFDNGKAREEIVMLAVNMVKKNPEIGAILLECSDMPPYAAYIQEATQLPVFDFITLINWLHNSVAQKPYDGWI